MFQEKFKKQSLVGSSKVEKMIDGRMSRFWSRSGMKPLK